MSTSNFGITALLRLNSSVTRFHLQSLGLMQAMRVCLPGVVKAFYPEAQAVDVQITTNEYVWFNTPGSGAQSSPTMSLQTQAQTLPLLAQIPILISNGGGVNLTVPIAVGDEIGRAHV